MLLLLLDEQLSPQIARQIVSKRPDVAVESVHHWHEASFKSQTDEAILIAAAAERRTLVTYDQKTILPVLVRWGHSGVDHGGVIFVDDRSIASSNIGALVQSLILLWDDAHDDDWTNRVDYLRRAP